MNIMTPTALPLRCNACGNAWSEDIPVMTTSALAIRLKAVHCNECGLGPKSIYAGTSSAGFDAPSIQSGTN